MLKGRAKRMAVEVKKYSKELRDQVLKEVKDTGNMALVVRRHGLVYQTVAGSSLPWSPGFYCA